MKKFFNLSFIAAVILLSTLQVGVVSCTKETLIRDTVKTITRDTVIVRDTIRIYDTINAQILTSHSWKLQELRGVYNNTRYYYFRGGTSNTGNYDNEYITFRPDKTGTYVEPSGTTHQLTWELVHSPRVRLTYNIANLGTQASTIITWENLVYKGGSLSYDEYYSQGSNHSHMQAVRISTNN